MLALQNNGEHLLPSEQPPDSAVLACYHTVRAGVPKLPDFPKMCVELGYISAEMEAAAMQMFKDSVRRKKNFDEMIKSKQQAQVPASPKKRTLTRTERDFSAVRLQHSGAKPAVVRTPKRESGKPPWVPPKGARPPSEPTSTVLRSELSVGAASSAVVSACHRFRPSSVTASSRPSNVLTATDRLSPSATASRITGLPASNVNSSGVQRQSRPQVEGHQYSTLSSDVMLQYGRRSAQVFGPPFKGATPGRSAQGSVSLPAGAAPEAVAFQAAVEAAAEVTLAGAYSCSCRC